MIFMRGVALLRGGAVALLHSDRYAVARCRSRAVTLLRGGAVAQ